MTIHKFSEFLNNTTPEQRARMRWEQKQMAKQGFYPYGGKTPIGFDRVRGLGIPTLKVNSVGEAIAPAFSLIVEGAIKSYREAASFLTASTGLEIPPTKARSILKNPIYKGYSFTGGELVKRKFIPPVSEQIFGAAQSTMASWKKR